MALEVTAAEVTFGLQMSDDGLDGRAASQLALDDNKDAALLARDEDAAGVLRVAAAVAQPVGASVQSITSRKV